MQPERELRAAAERIEGLLAEVGALGDAQVRAKAEELVRLLMSLYGAGLDRIMEIIAGDSGGDGGGSAGGAGAAADRIFDRLADDGLVSSLLVLHGLHPVELETRVRRALDGVRPYLGSHGGDVKLLGVEDGVVRLRLEGACHGCPSSAITMKLAVEHAIEKAAPEVTGIEVEGLESAAAGAMGEAGGGIGDALGAQVLGRSEVTVGAHGSDDGELLQIGRNGQRAQAAAAVASGAQDQGAAVPPSLPGGAPGGRRPQANLAGASWIALGLPPQPGPGGLAALDLAGIKVVACKVDETWYAYRDACPSCGSLLAGGALQAAVLACPACGRRYDVRRAGGCVDGAGLHLDPLPLLHEEGALRIAVPVAAP